jgi:hypothetical protein
VWLQWYAFDVIGSITFQRRFGFMEERKDVDGMIDALDKGLFYGGIVSQVPALHHWLMGNRWVAKFIAAQPFVGVADPLRTIVWVGFVVFFSDFLLTCCSLLSDALMTMIESLRSTPVDRTFLLGCEARKRRANPCRTGI